MRRCAVCYQAGKEGARVIVGQSRAGDGGSLDGCHECLPISLGVIAPHASARARLHARAHASSLWLSGCPVGWQGLWTHMGRKPLPVAVAALSLATEAISKSEDIRRNKKLKSIFGISRPNMAKICSVSDKTVAERVREIKARLLPLANDADPTAAGEANVMEQLLYICETADDLVEALPEPAGGPGRSPSDAGLFVESPRRTHINQSCGQLLQSFLTSYRLS